MKITQFIQTIDGLSDNTKRVYEQSLWQLDSVIKGEEPTEQEIYAFLRNYGASSLHRHKAAFKAYLEYLGQPWPFNRRQFAQSRQRIPRYVQPEKVKEMADAAETQDDYMYIWTLFQLGCRIQELMNILPVDITHNGVALVVKGGWQKIKPVTKSFLQELKKYAGKKKGKVFPRPYSFYYQRLKYLAGKVGIDHVTPHMLRHARAVDLLNRGMPLAYVQQFLGHANINTTAIYLQITGGELAQHLERVENGGTSTMVDLVKTLSPEERAELRSLLLESEGEAVAVESS
jgi:integrase/recombinase XerD